MKKRAPQLKEYGLKYWDEFCKDFIKGINFLNYWDDARLIIRGVKTPQQNEYDF